MEASASYGGYGAGGMGGYGASRWDGNAFSTSSYGTPGWRRRRPRAAPAAMPAGAAARSNTARAACRARTRDRVRGGDRRQVHRARRRRRTVVRRLRGSTGERTDRSGFAGRLTDPFSANRSRGANQPPRKGGGLYSSARAGGPREIEGTLVAKSVADEPSRFSAGDRVFHIKFGGGTVALVEGNKLTVDFDRAGQKRVLDGFVEPA